MTTAGRRAILVLGMHRSGTSATARVLNLLGVEVGDKLVAPAADNSLGFWEHADAVDLNERLLLGLGRSWDDIRPMPEDWLQSEIARQSVQSARELIRANFLNTPLWLIKDPRLCRVVPIWLQALEAEHIEPLCLFVARQPFEVALSLGKRDGTPGKFACFLWLRYMLEAEHSTRGYSRVMMTYDNLLLDWRGCMQKVLASFGITWEGDEAAAAAVGGYLSRAERHHMNSSGLASVQRSGFLAGVMNATYNICVALAKLPNSPRKWVELGAMQPRVERLFRRFHRELPEILEAMYRVRAKAYERERFYMDATTELVAEARRCGAAFAVAEKLALERLTELGQVTKRLSEADQALAAAGELGAKHIKELRVLDQALAAAQLAHADASKLAIERMHENEQLRDHILKLETVLENAERLAVMRLTEIERLMQGNESDELTPPEN
jgi:hypothetical protein